ncbi:MAG: hypothetical protein WD016_04490 [Balneolaceae bacterium]
MASVKIRKFNRSGLQVFEDLLDDLISNPSHAEWNTSLKMKIDKILFDNEITSEFGDYEIDRDKEFENRYDFGEYLYGIFKSKHVEKEIGMLSWLALLFFDQICKKSGKNNRLQILSKYRYIPEIENSWRFYRHLVLTPILVWQRLKEDSILLLSNPLYESGDAVEQLMSRQDFIANDKILTVARKLYIDEIKRKPKSRAFSDSEPGNAKRLARDIVPQLSMTYDLYEAPVNQILTLLPDEFDKWKN